MSKFSRWLRGRKPPTPYEHLRDAPRYQPGAVSLLGEPFRIADGVSFHGSYREIFQEEIYRFETANSAPRIIDAGANCGQSTVYFKRRYPAAQIIAVEADPQIFAILKENVARRRLSNVTLLNKAIAAGASHVRFHHEGADAGRIHALETSTQFHTVPAVSLDDLLAEPTDFLKIDVEGAETDALCASTRLDRVAQLFVEYHSFADSGQSLHRLLEKLAASGFRYYMHTQFGPRRPLIEDASNLGMDLQLNIFAKRRVASAVARSAA